MPKFKVHGRGRDSGRARHREYRARSEAEAIEAAEADGTEVERVERLPDEPPTERQLEFAEELGLEIPEGATKESVSEQISAELLRRNPPDPAASEHFFELAHSFGLEPDETLSKKRLFDFIAEQLGTPGREQELASWFIYRVCRHFVQGGEDHPAATSPQSPVVQEMASVLAADPKVISSIRRYQGRELIWFGQWTTPDGYEMHGGSKRTQAYKAAAQLVQDKLDLDPPGAGGGDGGHGMGSAAGGTSGGGCVVMLTAMAISLLCIALLVVVQI